MNKADIKRYYELLADQATVGLDADSKTALAELEQSLLSTNPEHDWASEAESIALAAAAVDQLLSMDHQVDMPSGIMANALTVVDQQLNTETTGTVSDLAKHKSLQKTRRAQWLGWYAAAAALLVVIYLGSDRIIDTTPTLADQRDAILQQAEAETIQWAESAEAGYQQVSGDVVWDNETQQGFMRLVNLPINDPDQSQYQLWIVDPDRDKHPVDGGVFDITQAGEVLIPINAKLPIVSAAAFAITLEQPGGVVVSAGPLLVVAAKG